jgi:hypothetical protein
MLLVFSIGSPDLWVRYLSHWTIPPAIARIMILLIGLVLMDNLFELGNPLVITLKNPGIKIEIKKIPRLRIVNYLSRNFLVRLQLNLILL